MKSVFMIPFKVEMIKSNPRSFIIVDDDPAFTFAAEMLIRHLVPESNIQSKHSVDEALSALEQYIPDIIFVDINMPNVNGWELIEKLKTICPHKKIFILSSSIDQNDIRKAQSYKIVNDFISKPLTINRLQEIIR